MISANALIIIAKPLASTSINSNLLVYAEAIDSVPHEHWKRAMKEECTSIVLNNTFAIVNSREGRQLRVKQIGTKWVFKTKHHPDSTIRYTAHQVIQGYEQKYFGETYAPVGKLTTFRYLITQVGKHYWIIDHLDVVTALLNPEVKDDYIYPTQTEGRLEGLNAPTIVVRLKKALYSLKQAPRHWQNYINRFFLCLEFIHSLADPNLSLRSDGILMLLYVNDISMLFPEDAMPGVFVVKARIPEQSKIKTLCLSLHFISIDIHRKENATGISLGQQAFITTILKPLTMQNAHGASTPMDPKVKLNLPEDRGEKGLKDIKGYQAIVGSLMYTALETRPDISITVAALGRFNSGPFTSHLTEAK